LLISGKPEISAACSLAAILRDAALHAAPQDEAEQVQK
jgi:hypothetical protein